MKMSSSMKVFFVSTLRRCLSLSSVGLSTCEVSIVPTQVPQLPNGLMAVYKPPGWTSTDVVSRIKGELVRGFRKAIAEEKQQLTRNVNDVGSLKSTPKRIKLKVGHGGTLDPMATGVLVLGFGTGTKQLEKYLQGAKGYSGIGLLGSETDTLDSTGEVTETMPWDHVTSQSFMEVLDQFRGDIYQIPPMYSALRKNGVRLHTLARQKQIVEREPRLVKIYELDGSLINENDPEFKLDVMCSGGTYIRTLIADIARALNTRGHMTALVRTKQGPFSLENCLPQQDWEFRKILRHLEVCNALVEVH